MFLSKFLNFLLLLVFLSGVGAPQAYARIKCEALFSNPAQFTIAGRYDPHLVTELDRGNSKIKLSVFNIEENDPTLRKLLLKFLDKVFGAPASLVMGVEKLSQVAKNFSEISETTPYWTRLAESFRLKITAPTAEQKIPRDGPLMVVVPHVAGGIDLISVASVLSQHRTEPAKMKLLITRRLRGIEGLTEHAFLIDPSNNTKAHLYNAGVEKEIADFLATGGCVVIAPAGGNAVRSNKNDSYAWDTPWRSGVYSIAKRFVRANQQSLAILPVFIDVQMSPLYQNLRFKSKALGDAILPREMAKLYDKQIPLKFGSSIDADQLLDASADWALNNLELHLSPSDLRKAPKNSENYSKFAQEVLTRNAFVSRLRAMVYELK